MDSYQIAALIFGAFYSAIEFGKWIYNRVQTQEQTRMLEVIHDIIAVKDGQGRPVVYRDTADQTQLQKETITEMRSAIHEQREGIRDLGQLVRDTNENVRDTNKILQTVLLQKQG